MLKNKIPQNNYLKHYKRIIIQQCFCFFSMTDIAFDTGTSFQIIKEIPASVLYILHFKMLNLMALTLCVGTRERVFENPQSFVYFDTDPSPFKV